MNITFHQLLNSLSKEALIGLMFKSLDEMQYYNGRLPKEVIQTVLSEYDNINDAQYELESYPIEGED